ncbi:MAG: NAD(P)H-hydrate dehydratase [Clostridium sp.]|nr:NAD(P)H-hydrate dehydratase [Clostridium sp.]
MKYLVTQAQMKQYDKNTIESLKIPSIVLMERAALVTAEQLRKEKGDGNYRVLVVSGCGNNGGDGLAVGRLLSLQGCHVDFVLLGDSKKCSRETALQLDILAQYKHKPFDRIPEGEYDIVIDAIFGIGLTREIEGIYKEAVRTINEQNAYVCSIDIPSGIDADTGKVLGCAVEADLTVAYGFYKAGEFLYPGAGYCGKIVCGQMGIDEHSFLGQKPLWYTYDALADVQIPKRKPDGNKGTFGKALVIAGSDTICGAALLAARGVFKTGAGMVRIVTSVKNRETLQQTLPEAMLTLYDTALWKEEPDSSFLQAFKKAVEWADCILIGPGIGMEKEAQWLLHYCLKESALPMVIDADGLNLLAEKKNDDTQYIKSGRNVILTPHLGEFARLYGCTAAEASAHLTVYPKELADRLGCIVVCKDVRTIVAYAMEDSVYMNTAGNAGMATAGSGDVLAGIITGLLAQGMEAKEAAVSGVYLHSLAGDMAAGVCGEYAMMASDIIEQIQELLQ